MRLHLPKQLLAVLSTALLAGTVVCNQQAYGYSRVLTTESTTVSDVTYNGHVYTMLNDKAATTEFASRNYKQYVYNEVTGTWGDGDTTYASGNSDIDTPDGTGYFWTMFCSASTAGHGISYGQTLHLASSASQQKISTDFSDFCLGGLIVDADETEDSYSPSAAVPAYWFYRAASMSLDGTNAVNLTIGNHARFSYKDAINVNKGGVWDVASNASIRFANNAYSDPTTMKINTTEGVVIKGAGTVYLGLSSNDNGKFGLQLVDGATMTVSTESTLSFDCHANSVGELSFGVGAKIILDGGTIAGRFKTATDVLCSVTKDSVLKATMLHAENTATNIELKGGSLSLFGAEDSTWALGTVSASSVSSILQTTNYGGVVTISALKGENRASLLSAASSRKHTIFIVNGGDFSGDTLTFGITETGNYRSAALELGSETVAEHSVINIRNASGAEKKASMALAVNANKVKVAGVQDDTKLNACDLSIISGTATTHTNDGSESTKPYESSDTTYRTLEITGSGTQSTSAAVKGYVNISMTGRGSQSFTGDMSAFNGSLSVSAGSLNITNNVAAASQINVSGGTLTFDGSVGATGSAAAPATVKGGKLEVKGTYYGSLTQQGGEAVIANLSGNGALKSSAGTATVSNATGFSGALEATGGSVTVSSASSLSALKATNGSTLNAKGIADYSVTTDPSGVKTATGGLSVSELVIGTGSKVQAWGSGDTWSASAEATVLLEKGADGSPVTLTVGTAGQTGTSTLNANLVLDGATVTLNNALTMGSTLTLNNVTLSMSGLLGGHIAKDAEIILFRGVDSLTLGTSSSSAAITEGDNIDARTVFSNLGQGDFLLTYTGGAEGSGGIVALVAQRDVPEPTTATLSLLALIGLAARRRRKA